MKIKKKWVAVSKISVRQKYSEHFSRCHHLRLILPILRFFSFSKTIREQIFVGNVLQIFRKTNRNFFEHKFFKSPFSQTSSSITYAAAVFFFARKKKNNFLRMNWTIQQMIWISRSSSWKFSIITSLEEHLFVNYGKIFAFLMIGFQMSRCRLKVYRINMKKSCTQHIFHYFRRMFFSYCPGGKRIRWLWWE